MTPNSIGSHTERRVRYRAVLFDNKLGPWRARVDLAKDDAVTAGHGARDPYTGFVYLDPGVRMEQDRGEPPPMTEEQQVFAVALALFRRDGAAAGMRLARAADRQCDEVERQRAKRVAVRIEDLIGEARRLYAKAW